MLHCNLISERCNKLLTSRKQQWRTNLELKSLLAVNCYSDYSEEFAFIRDKYYI